MIFHSFFVADKFLNVSDRVIENYLKLNVWIVTAHFQTAFCFLNTVVCVLYMFAFVVQ